MYKKERVKLIIENWFSEKTSIKPSEEGLNNLVDRIIYDKKLHIVDVSNNEVVVCDTETESICDRCGNWSPDSDIECEFCKQNDF